MADDILLSTSDKIPTKRIVSLKGEISATKTMWMGEHPDQLFAELKKKAREMGANAVINAVYYPSMRGPTARATGFAVIVEDELPPPPPPPPP